MLFKIFFTAIFSIAATSLVAQQTPAKKKECGCAFTSINQLGLVAGEKNESFQLQTINGLRYRTWMVGAGVGIDGYRYRSIPLFLHLRKEFSLKTDAIFLYNDIGLNYPWLNSNQKIGWGESDYNHGVYYDGGIGYKILLRKKHAFLLSGGFSLKEFKESRSSITCPFVGPCLDQKDEYNYSLRRISIKLGIQL